jgi:predicted Zn-dependent peptidase
MRLAAYWESGFDGAQASAELWLEAISTGAGAPRVEQTVADLEKVTAEEVQSLARAAFAPEALRWILSGEQGPVAAALGGNPMGALRRLTSDW